MPPWKGVEEYFGLSEPQYRGPARPMWSSDDEANFWKWYQPIAQANQWNPNPDDPGHHYDYRSAYQQGFKQDENNHWPSNLKYLDHPRRFINGYDTTTGGQAPMITNWLEEK